MASTTAIDRDLDPPPTWFTENCTKTAQQLLTNKKHLIVRDTQLVDGPAEATDIPETEDSETGLEIEFAAYDAMRSVLVKPHGLSEATDTFFKHDAMYVRFPKIQETFGHQLFLQAVVEHFAMEISADLITLSIHDIVDLAQHYASQEAASKHAVGFDEYMRVYFGKDIKSNHTDKENDAPLFQLRPRRIVPERNSNGGEETSGSVSRIESLAKSDAPIDEETISEQEWWEDRSTKGEDFTRSKTTKDEESENSFLPAVLRSAQQENNSGPHPSLHRKPLVIHLQDVGQWLPYLGSCLCSICTYPGIDKNTATSKIYGSNILERLQEAISAEKSNGANILLLMSSHRLGSSQDGRILAAAGPKSLPKAIQVVPVKSEFQKTMMHDQRHDVEYHMKTNTRQLGRVIREKICDPWQCELVLPFVRWTGMEQSNGCEAFGERLLPSEDLEELAIRVAEDCQESHITRVMWNHFRKEKILKDWDDGVVKDKWSHFPPETQKIIRTIDSSTDVDELKLEKQLLNLVVCPETLEEGWNDIEVDSDIKETLTQIIDHSSRSVQSAYGLLKRGQLGGALLYGPPGTGKTHLARVAAYEFSSVLISASSADITDMYVGQTEKTIKGLFSLARKLSPCIIFIDEAESLFRQRQSDDYSWERDRTNQFLAEMDNLVKRKNAPFVLLASNYPGQLDHAVLRRAPTRLYISLPYTTARERIIDIFLREEVVNSDVDIKGLAVATKGYSGSDIQSLCVHAALAAAADNSVNENGRRSIAKAHFEIALNRFTPTVSEATLKPIRTFAEEFDQGGLRKMQDMNEATQPEQLPSDLGTGDHDPVIQAGMQYDTHLQIANIHSSSDALDEEIEEIINLALVEPSEDSPLKLRFITPLFLEAWIADESYCDFKITSPDEHKPEMDFISVSYCWNHTQSMAGLPTIPEYCIQDVTKPKSPGRPIHCPELVFHRAVQFARQCRCPYIWIDQECINQQDPTDIEKHLQIMHRVYKESRWTVALLSWTSPTLPALEELQKLIYGVGDGAFLRTKWIPHSLNCATHDRWFTRTWTYHERLCASSLHYLVPVDPTVTLPEHIMAHMIGNDFHIDVPSISSTRDYRKKFESDRMEVKSRYLTLFEQLGKPTQVPLGWENMHPYLLVLTDAFEGVEKCDNFLVADRVSILGNICNLPRRLLSNRLNDSKYGYSVCLLALFLGNCFPDRADRLKYLQATWENTLQHTIQSVFKEWAMLPPPIILMMKEVGFDLGDLSRRFQGVYDD